MKVGDRIIYGDLDSVTSLREGVISKIKKDVLWVEGQPDACFYIAYCWPIEWKERLVKVIEERAVLKAAYDKSLTLLLELRNDYTRSL